MRNTMRRYIYTTIILLILTQVGCAQDDPFSVPEYPYINSTENKIADLSKSFSDTLTAGLIRVMNGKGKFTIAHIGDSHIQADFFTAKVRCKLQKFHPGASGTRGLVFPYDLAKTNNPGNYSIKSPNTWIPYFSTKELKPSNLGIFGIKISTHDSIIQLEIKVHDKVSEPFNQLTLYYGATSAGEIITINGSDTLSIQLTQGASNAASLLLNDYCTKINITIVNNGCFDIHGIEFRNDLPGLQYHAIGLNGASAASYNKSLLFAQQLQQIKPDIIILSLGTNDAYAHQFTDVWFENEYRTLIQTIQKTSPSTPLLLTTPNDHSLTKEKNQERAKIVKKIILETANQMQLATWDFHTVMGGDKSIAYWAEDNLSARDFIHLSVKGYLLKADLFFVALMKTFDTTIDNTSNVQ